MLEVSIVKKLSAFVLRAEFCAKEEVLGLLGASGSGKSMLFRCIAGIETPDSGRIVLDGRVLYDSEAGICLPPRERHVGYLFQDYALFPHMTVGENIRIAIPGDRRQTKEREALLKEWLEKMQLYEVKDQYPDRISGGQKQRTAMVRMLMSEPECILLDEPFAALDSFLKAGLIRELKGYLREYGKTVLFVSHDRDEIYSLSDSIACLERGNLGQVQGREEFFLAPGTREAAILSGCKNISRMQWLDETHVFAHDFGTELEVCVPDALQARRGEIGYIGIRAHAFGFLREEAGEPAGVIPDQNGAVSHTGNPAVNRIDITECVVEEALFEYTCLCRTPSGGLLQVKYPRTRETEASAVLAGTVRQLTVAPEDILLLR